MARPPHTRRLRADEIEGGFFMYLITGGVGFLACVIFIILIIAAAMRGKPCVVPLVAVVLALALF